MSHAMVPMANGRGMALSSAAGAVVAQLLSALEMLGLLDASERDGVWVEVESDLRKDIALLLPKVGAPRSSLEHSGAGRAHGLA